MGAARALALVAVLALAACAGGDPGELVAVPFGEEGERHDHGADGRDHETPGFAPLIDAASLDIDGSNGADMPADGVDRTDRDEDDAGVHEAVALTGPPPALVSEHLDERVEDAVRHDHLLADLTDGGTVDLVIAAISADDQGVVEVVRWEDGELHPAVRVPVGRAHDLGTLRLADLGAHEGRVLVLPVRYQGTSRVVMWEATDDGDLRAPDGCPLEDGGTLRSVQGVTLTLACEPDVAPRADLLVWGGGAFTSAADAAASGARDARAGLSRR